MNQADFSSTIPANLLYLLDPEQTHAYLSALREDTCWIYGSDEVKRLQVLLQLALHQTFHGQTTLVCIDPEIEHTFTEMIGEAGMEGFVMRLHKPITAAAMGALQVARKKKSRTDTQAQCELAISQTGKWIRNTETPFMTLSTPVFGDLSWRELVDKNALAPESPYKSQLAASLVASDFELSHQEYWHLRGRIKTFQRLRILRTPSFDLLDALHGDIFEKEGEESNRESVKKVLTQVIENGRKLLSRIGDLVYQYRRDISGVQYDALHDFHARATEIRELLETGEAQFGQEFFSESTFNAITNKFKRTVSSRSRAIQAHRTRIREAYESLVDVLESAPVNSTTIEALFTDEAHTMEHIAEGVDICLDALQAWASRIDATATDQKKRLNAQNIPRGHLLRHLIHDTEKDIEKYIEWVNGCKVLREVREVNALSLEKRSLVIRDIVMLCTRLKDALVDFEAYFLWRQFWSQLDNNVKALLESLDLLDDADQVAAFDRWYIENVLDQIPRRRIAREVPPTHAFEEHMRDLRAVVLTHVKARLHQQRHQVLKSMRGTQKALIQSISNGNYSAVADELQVIPAQDLARLFPVVVCTPSELRDYGYYFDRLCVVAKNGCDFKSYIAQSKSCILFTREGPAEPTEQLAARSCRLLVHRSNGGFQWKELPATGKLQKLQTLASQLHPHCGSMRLYNCKGIEIFSFLGDTVDKAILQRLGVPYKQTGDPAPTVKHITEAMLDNRKPIVMLTRDYTMGELAAGHLHWHVVTLNRFKACGLCIINSWSLDWKQEPTRAIHDLVKEVEACIPVPVSHRKPEEETSANLESDGAIEPARVQTSSEGASTGTPDADLRSGAPEMGSLPA